MDQKKTPEEVPHDVAQHEDLTGLYLEVTEIQNKMRNVRERLFTVIRDTVGDTHINDYRNGLRVAGLQTCADDAAAAIASRLYEIQEILGTVPDFAASADDDEPGSM